MTTILTVADSGIYPVWEVAEKTWRPYCQRHGYVLKVIRDLPMPYLHPSWNKVKACLDEIKCATGPVWVVDADMAVARPETPLESGNLDSMRVWFSSDWNGLCAGLFRVTPGLWQEWFLSTALFCRDVKDPDQFGKGLGCKWEQNTFKVLIREFPALSEKVGLLPASLVTDKPPNGNSLIYHYGARPNPERIRMMNEIHRL